MERWVAEGLGGERSSIPRQPALPASPPGWKSRRVWHCDLAVQEAKRHLPPPHPPMASYVVHLQVTWGRRILKGSEPSSSDVKNAPENERLGAPRPLLQPKSRGARAGCPGMGCRYQLGAAGPQTGAPAGGGQQQRNRGTPRPCPALKFREQSKARVRFTSCSRSLPPSFPSKSSASAAGPRARPGAIAAQQAPSRGAASEASAEFLGA